MSSNNKEGRAGGSSEFPLSDLDSEGLSSGSNSPLLGGEAEDNYGR